MAGQFELGAKHQEVAKNTQALVAELGDNANPKEKIKSYLDKFNALFDDKLGMAVALEEIAKQDSLVANVLAEQACFGEIMKKYGSAEAEQALSNGETIALLCLEPGFSCLKDLRTKAVKVQDGWKVSGVKLISEEQLYADKYLVFAKDEEDVIRLFALQEQNIKVSEESKLVSNSKITLNQAEISTEIKNECCIGAINDDFENMLTLARTMVAAVAVGIGHSALSNSIQVVKQTKNAQGESISSSQSLQFTLADLFSEVEGSRMLTYYSADSIDKGCPSIKLASMAKVKASEAAASTAVETLHIFGNVGFVSNKDLSLLQRANDSRVKGGTNRVQKSQIYQYMLAKK